MTLLRIIIPLSLFVCACPDQRQPGSGAGMCVGR